MFKNLKKDNKGFTIIEVLIVLAIAGLIMLIVFLAVPALQRNQRNSSRTNDVSRALGSVQEILNNSNGNIASVTSANVQSAVGTPSYYTATDITVSGTAVSANTAAHTNPDTVVIYTGARCDVANGVNVARPGTGRQVVAVFAVESAGGPVARCQSS